jgi:hypothetical protein
MIYLHNEIKYNQIQGTFQQRIARHTQKKGTAPGPARPRQPSSSSYSTR